MTALMKLVMNSASIGSLDVRLYPSSLGRKLHHPVFPALMSTSSKIRLTDELICTPVDINADMGRRLMWTSVRAPSVLSVWRTRGPDSQASWIHLSAAALPADLWALQWKSLAAPHSVREKGGGREEARRWRERESENGVFENRLTSFVPITIIQGFSRSGTVPPLILNCLLFVCMSTCFNTR